MELLRRDRLNDDCVALPVGRNEETDSKYAEGIRVKQYPNRRQQQQILKLEVRARLWIGFLIVAGRNGGLPYCLNDFHEFFCRLALVLVVAPQQIYFSPRDLVLLYEQAYLGHLDFASCKDLE